MRATPQQRDAAQAAIAALRSAPVRRRRHLPQGLRDAGEELTAGVAELVAGIALLLVGCAVAAAVRWGWGHSAPVTLIAVVGIGAAEIFGANCAVRAIRRQQKVRFLPAVALGLAAVVGWGAGTWLFYAGW